MSRRSLVSALAACVAAMALPATAAAAPAERISVTDDGRQALGRSSGASLSADGRLVAFDSEAQLVPGLPGGGVFVRDRVAGTTEMVSVTSDGKPSDGRAHYATRITRDGRFVAFTSDAVNLDDRDTGRGEDVFVHDRRTGRTELASLGDEADIPGGISWVSAISDDGRYVAFATGAQKDDGSIVRAVFLRDRQAGVTERVSVGRDGGVADGAHPSISADGRLVAFHSEAPLVAGDSDGTYDVYVRDRRDATTMLASPGRDGADGGSFMAQLSGDAGVVAFTSVADADAGTLDVFVHDRRTGATERVSESSTGVGGDGASYVGGLSADGRHVVFSSDASNLVTGDTNGKSSDVFVHDRATGTTARANLNRTGAQANYLSHSPAISADGGVVAFDSYAFNLVDGDTNNEQDVFAVDLRAADPCGGATCTPPPCPGEGYAGAVACERPAAYWRFDDVTANLPTADAVGAAPAAPLGEPALAPGVVGGAAALNLTGRARRDEFYAGDLFDFPGRVAFTLEAWIKPLDLPAQTSRIFSKEHNGHAGYLLGVNASGVVFSRYVPGRADTVSAPLPARRWSHVAAVYDGHQLSLYVNGRRAATRPSTVALPDIPETLWIGSKNGQWRFYAGWLDEAAIYPRALPADAVAAHWAAAG